MSYERVMKLLAKMFVKLVRVLFRLPNPVVAVALLVGLKIAKLAGQPKEALSDLNDAYVAMRKGPPLSESLRGMILKSDPEIMANVIFNNMRGDPPLKEVDPW